MLRHSFFFFHLPPSRLTRTQHSCREDNVFVACHIKEHMGMEKNDGATYSWRIIIAGRTQKPKTAVSNTNNGGAASHAEGRCCCGTVIYSCIHRHRISTRLLCPFALYAAPSFWHTHFALLFFLFRWCPVPNKPPRIFFLPSASIIRRRNSILACYSPPAKPFTIDLRALPLLEASFSLHFTINAQCVFVKISAGCCAS